MFVASVAMISGATRSSRWARLLFAFHGAHLASVPFIQACLRPDVHAGERTEKSKNVHKPQNRGDHHHRVQDGLDRSLHWYEAVDQPKQNTHHEQNLYYLK
jgi:hypothetical protein